MPASTAYGFSANRPLRLWPGVVLAALEVLLFLAVPLVVPDQSIFGLLGAVVCGALVLLWWLFFSRAPWSERIGAILVMVAGVLALKFVVDPSIGGAGQGMLIYVLPVPVVAIALVAAVAATRRASTAARRALVAAAILIGCSTFALIRTGGVHRGFFDFHWRWTPTPEELLLAQDRAAPAPVETAAAPATTAPAPVTARPVASDPAAAIAPPTTRPATSEPASATTRPATSEPASPATRPATSEPEITRVEWPGFRGPNRDDVVAGVRIETDWTQSPPIKMWSRPIGPGWSSFAVAGDLLYTQEQRGGEEIVACYRVSTGAPVWKHRDAVRFYESNAGAGPRATPAVGGGRVYAIGATGILNALDARTGAVVWSRNAATDTKTTVPIWGFAGSPLVEGDVVIVATAGKLAAYETGTGKPRWFGPVHRGSYSSPHRATIHGVTQILMLSTDGATSVAPDTGAVLWDYTWGEGTTIVQPALTEDGDILINAITGTGGLGIRRLTAGYDAQTSPFGSAQGKSFGSAQGKPGPWTVTEKWTSNGLKPYFNDFVVNKGHAFGFDGNILSCINLSDGKRVWKGGRYGDGQLLLLADQDVMIVLSEEGELALVSATPDKFIELGRFPAIEGKTWNHPALVGDVLLVRNGQEMAAFRLRLAGR